MRSPDFQSGLMRRWRDVLWTNLCTQGDEIRHDQNNAPDQGSYEENQAKSKSKVFAEMLKEYKDKGFPGKGAIFFDGEDNLMTSNLFPLAI